MARSTRRLFERDPNLTLTTPYNGTGRPQATGADNLSWHMDDTLWLTIAPIFRTVGLAEHRRLGPADDRRFINGLIYCCAPAPSGSPSRPSLVPNRPCMLVSRNG